MTQLEELHIFSRMGFPMFTYSPMTPEDILSLDIANLDETSENFIFDYYVRCLEKHPQYFFTARRLDGWPPLGSLHKTGETDLIYTNPIVGYIFGRIEKKDYLCSHISALSIGPDYRRMGLASKLHEYFEKDGELQNVHFYDLYVRKSNEIAIEFYKRLGYHVYRTVYDYYGMPVEDALDMRKPSSSDPNGETLVGGVNISSDDLP